MPFPPEVDQSDAGSRAAAGPASFPAFGSLTSWLLLGAALATCVAFLHFPGTRDVNDGFLPWLRLVREHGVAGAYARAPVQMLYPPGSFFLFGAAWGLTGDAFTELALLKILLTVATLAGGLVYGCWTRSALAAGSLIFATVLSSCMLGYLDVLYLAPLLLSLWALQARHLVLASLCFATAVLIKWQPVILGPFFLVQACDLTVGNIRRYRVWLPAAGRLALGAIGPIALSALLVDPVIILRAFGFALSHPNLSNQGLNPGWIAQLGCYLAQGSHAPRYFGIVAPDGLKLLFRGLFYASYILVFGTFLLRRRNFDEFAWFACVGFFMSYLFNVGVHENHLFVGMTVGFAFLCANHRAGLPMAIFLVLMGNLNLLLFYGIEGARIMRGEAAGAGFLTGVNMTVASVLFALINTIFGLACLKQVVKFTRTDWPFRL